MAVRAMLTIHFANRYEALTALLAARLDAPGVPRRHLFEPDELIVPSAAVRRRLTLDLARRDGVCANLRFGFLAQWLWQQVGRVLDAARPGALAGLAGPLRGDGDSPLQPALLTWRILAAFADADWVAGQPRLAAYLARADAVTRHALAQRVAGLLDQYGTYRPDWLAAWAHGRSALPAAGAAPDVDEAWQAALWRRLLAELRGESPGDGLLAATADPGLAPTLARLLATLGDAPPPGAGLPATAHVFCLPAIAPLHLTLLQQLGRWIDLHVYVLNPCQEYWFEVVDPRRLAWLQARGRAAGHEVGHRLLAAWGRPAQAQLSALVDACGDAAIDEGVFVARGGSSLLARLQDSILRLEDLPPASVPLDAADRSIELHVCHSLTRELEVLHDRLLALLAAPGAPAPGEVLVVLPDLDAAAPLVDAVFGTQPPQRALPYALTGRAASQVNPAARALLDLLALAGSRCTASDVFGLLQQPVVARRFGLDDEALQRVHGWLLDAGVHWALDAAQRAEADLPADGRHSFADGLARLFLGHALPSPAAPGAGGAAAATPRAGLLAAGDAEGSAAQALGALWAFVDALDALRQRVAAPLPAADWPGLLAEVLARFLQPPGRGGADVAQDADSAELRAALDALAAQWQASAPALPLALDVVRQALQQWLDDPARGGVPGGRITFSAMASLRHLPYRVVCVLGLDDGVFPGNHRPAEFDLMARHPRAGDRQRRLDERQLFLDLLLAAQDVLHLSHTGRSVRDNSALTPSVLVAELLDTLLPVLDAPAAQARAHLVVEHPLQPFAELAFRPDADPRLRSHHAEYAQALAAARAAATEAVQAMAPAADADPNDDPGDDPADDEPGDEAGALAADAAEAPPFFSTPLPPLAATVPGAGAAAGPAETVATLADLQRFFRHPSRALLQQRLGLTLRQPDEALDDDEPLLPDHRARRALARRLLPALAAGADDAALLALAAACPELPSGPLGQALAAQELPVLRGFAQRAAELGAGAALPPLVLDLAVPGDARDGGGGPGWRLQGALTGLRADGLLLQRCDLPRVADTLDAWIAHCALCAAAPAGVAPVTRWLGRDRLLQFRPVDAPLAELGRLLALRAEGLCAPLYFFPRSAWAYASAGQSLAPARAAWRPSRQRPHAEQTDPAHRLVLHGLPDPLDAGLPRFVACADAVLLPLLQHLDETPLA